MPADTPTRRPMPRGGRLAVTAATLYAAAAAGLLAAVVALRPSEAPADAATPVASAPVPDVDPPAATPTPPDVDPPARAAVVAPADDGPADDLPPVPHAVAPPLPERPPTFAPSGTPSGAARALGPAHFVGELQRVPEIGLHTFDVSPNYFTAAAVLGNRHPMLTLLDGRDDFRGVPVLRGAACELSPAAAAALATASAQLRRAVGDLLAPAAGGDPNGLKARAAAAVGSITEVRPTFLVWVLQTEHDVLRRSMIEMFARIVTPGTTQALAHRAVFEPDPVLRRVATGLLRKRPASPARPLLLAALRYPWPTVADHAADALAALQDKKAVPALVELLDAPDPAGPVPGPDGTPVVRELVRINHARNCQLCHAPSLAATDPVRAAVPSPGLPLPPAFTGSGGGGSYGGAVPAQSPGQAESAAGFVRADVTYLRPDFSMALAVENPGPWPTWQRHDFLVRTRPVRPGEADRPATGSYPQRAAVLRALRKITGQDFGDRAAEWRTGLNSDRTDE